MKSKRIFGMILVISVLFIMAAVPVSAYQDPQISKVGMPFYIYKCTGDGVNFREGPSTNAWSYGSLWTGDKVLAGYYNGVLYKENGFCFCQTFTGALYNAAGTIYGWVSSTYLKQA